MAFIGSPRKALGKVSERRIKKEEAIFTKFRKTGRPEENGRD
ncbi:MAG TPA: hypothetical protein VFM18_19610 [Methanosarcina sp.]|nr:hypothetical protein [Methanosarcina sp.]